ncbi:MAG: hypothetical protein INQ03_17970 [Candidatus Heimdallarchaeota archaeon]|nr:hypothetical protein [Candidatus Heimdallarchaeota archaeon]
MTPEKQVEFDSLADYIGPYCEDCDDMLEPIEITGGLAMFCPDCQEFKSKGIVQSSIYENKEIQENPDKGILIVEAKNTTTGRSKREMFCSDCKDMQLVEYWEIQTRSADESATRFFRCTNCDKNWREYD